MTLRPKSELRKVPGLTAQQLALIEAFMQGAVYSWVKNNTGAFAVRDLVGGTNRDWTGTPLQVLYETQTAAGKAPDDAADAAAIELGWIVKTMLDNDARVFEVRRSGLVAAYQWIP